jgi:hypothetical protein
MNKEKLAYDFKRFARFITSFITAEALVSKREIINEYVVYPQIYRFFSSRGYLVIPQRKTEDKKRIDFEIHYTYPKAKKDRGIIYLEIKFAKKNIFTYPKIKNDILKLESVLKNGKSIYSYLMIIGDYKKINEKIVEEINKRHQVGIKLEEVYKPLLYAKYNYGVKIIEILEP